MSYFNFEELYFFASFSHETIITSHHCLAAFLKESLYCLLLNLLQQRVSCALREWLAPLFYSPLTLEKNTGRTHEKG